ncbi:MAG TPA: hypothetical protein VFG54_06865 [Prolixibacteraceae bacterium]|nr:hypothetical protein [Prolixibacteraceae bacterium]
MKPLKSFFTVTYIIAGFLLPTSCSWAKESNDSASEKVFVGSTPGDSLIKAMLSIPNEINVDFIRWELKLNNTNEKQSSFLLNIVFGESQPNTLGFKEEHKKTFEGEYIGSENEIANHQPRLYHLKSSQFHQAISMVKLNDHLLHVLTPQNQLMVGNGGYSYTLNYKGPIKDQDFSLTTYSAFTNGSTLQTIYEGRTPCQDFAAEHRMNVSSSCFKLKWRLILNRDPASHQPTTYIMRKVVDNRPRDVEGKWTVIKGVSGHPNALIIQLDPEMPDKTISLLAGDDNILFFLHKDMHLFVGNEDFSFTLNKRIK